MPIKNTLIISAICLTGGSAVAAAGCSVTSHAVQPAAIGVPSSARSLEERLDEPGPVEVESLVAARWQVPRSGLLNLEDPKTRAAGLTDGPEPINIYLHVLRHPTRGLFIIDTGVERALSADPESSAVSGIVRSLAHVDEMQVTLDLASWLSQQNAPLAGVLLTHLHLDHVLGLPDVPSHTPIYVGAGETSAKGFLNIFTQSTTNNLLEGHDPLHEWQFQVDPSGQFAGVLDVFGDGSVWALHVPGHTPGSTAYVARTPQGPVLFTGDACHTDFGWRHGVEPGTFSSDQPTSRASLDALERFAARHPGLDVRLGHQPLRQESVIARE